MKNLAFWLTDRERDALFTLDVCPAAWPTFAGRTWKSLADKGLVNVAQDGAEKRAPELSGEPAKSLTRGLRTLTRAFQRAERRSAAVGSLGVDAGELLARPRLETLV